MRHLIAGLVIALATGSCATRPSGLQPGRGARVLVKTAHLPSGEPWYARWADHTWFDVRSDGGWWRVEVLGPWSGVRKQEISGADAFSDDRWGREAHVLADIGEPDAARIAAEVLAKAEGYPFADGYEAWPGPNSNTFAVWLSREVEGLEFDPYSTAVGRGHRGWIGAGWNPAGDGVEITTPLLGLEAGLLHGVDVQILAWTVGVGIWPPAIRLPFLRGIPGGWSAGPAVPADRASAAK